MTRPHRPYRYTDAGRKAMRSGGRARKLGRRLVDAENVADAPGAFDEAAVFRDFDRVADQEIETIAVSIGATGARRPASE